MTRPTVLRRLIPVVIVALASTAAAVAVASELDDAFRAAVRYEPGESRAALTTIERHVRRVLADDPRRGVVELRLIGLLQDPNATVACRAFVCRQLAIAGGDAAVPALAELLADPALSHMARSALERMPGDAPRFALRDAVLVLDGDLRLGAIGSLGRMRDPRAVAVLERVPRRDDATFDAVVAALGTIGVPADDALATIRLEMAMGRPDRLPQVLRAMLTCGRDHLERGRREDAEYLFREVWSSFGTDVDLRIGALHGMVDAAPTKAATQMVAVVRGVDRPLMLAVLHLVSVTSGEEVTRALAGALRGLPPDRQLLILDALGERGDPAAAPAILAQLDSANPEVADTALRVLGRMGDQGTVPRLVRLAAAGNATARTSVIALGGPRVDVAVAQLLTVPDARVRSEAARVLGARRARRQVKMLLWCALSDDVPGVRIDALVAIERLAGPEDAPGVVRALVQAPTDEVRDAAVAAAIATCRRRPNADERARPLVLAMTGADAATRAALLRAMSGVGGALAMRAVRHALDDADPAVSRAALAALAEWPDAAAAEALLAVAAHGAEPQRGVAFRGYVRAARLASADDPVRAIAMFRRAAGMATNDDERGVLLEALAGAGHVEAITLAEPLLERRGVARRAGLAMIAVARGVAGEHRAESLAAIDRVLERLVDDEEVRRAAGAALDEIQHAEGFVTAWRFAGPYTRDGAGGFALHAVPFGPETGTGADWRTLPEDALAPPGILDLMKIAPATECCGYVRAVIHSDRAQPARLELGSDDGVRVWLNDALVHEKNEPRGLTVGSDVCTVTLREGANTLLVKITQGGGDWQVCCRLRAPDGFPLTGVRIGEP